MEKDTETENTQMIVFNGFFSVQILYFQKGLIFNKEGLTFDKEEDILLLKLRDFISWKQREVRV